MALQLLPLSLFPSPRRFIFRVNNFVEIGAMVSDHCAAYTTGPTSNYASIKTPKHPAGHYEFFGILT